MSQPGDEGWIEVRGARTHNLQDVTVKLPRGQFVVVSGVSGIGDWCLWPWSVETGR